MPEQFDEATIRFHLTGARRAVLEIVAEAGPLDAEAIVARWEALLPGISQRHRENLPRMSAQVLWRLKNLGWVRQVGGAYYLTPEGRDVIFR